jgi:nucleoside-diphosphate-sugar epimerase
MRWTYASSKIAGEKACLAFGKQTKKSVLVLRPFNVFGLGQTGEGAVRDMIQAAQAGQPIVVHGDGSQVRAWCYIDDFIDGCIAAMFHPSLTSDVFNIGNPKNALSIAELAKLIKDMVPSDMTISKVPHFGTDIQYRTPDITKAAQILGFTPKVDLTEGLKKTVAWYKKHGF